MPAYYCTCDANYFLFLSLRWTAAWRVLRISRFIEASRVRVGTRRNCSFFCFSSIGEHPMTIIDVQNLFSSDEKARELLERLRWPAGPECPRCKMQQLARLSEKLL